jgi:hypothetical protein
MARPANLRRTLRAASVPLLLSLTAHGLLLLGLSFWPTPSRTTACVVESTRIALEACVLDPGSPVLRPGGDLPADLQGPDANITMAPRLPDTHPVSPETSASRGPTPAASDPIPPAGNSSGSPADGGPGGGNNLFPLPATAARVVYVLDRSVSMGEGDKLDLACREILVSLRRLPPTAYFQVVPYNSSAAPLRIGNRIDLLPAEPAILDRVADQLKDLSASGGTDHANALRRGLALRPDVLYFVTDADQLPYDQIEFITRGNPGAVIHIVELTRRRGGSSDGPLAQLARANGGTYRRVSIRD